MIKLEYQIGVSLLGQPFIIEHILYPKHAIKRNTKQDFSNKLFNGRKLLYNRTVY